MAACGMVQHAGKANKKSSALLDRVQRRGFSYGVKLLERTVIMTKVKSFFLNIVGFVLAFAAFFICTYVLSFILLFFSQIPIIGQLLFYPADTGWGSLVTLNTVPIIAGTLCAVITTKKCDWQIEHKVYIVIMVIAAVLSALNGGKIIVSVIGAISAIIGWGAEND